MKAATSSKAQTPADDSGWEVVFDDDFRSEEFASMDSEQRRALIAAADALEKAGPAAGRPLVGTLENRKHPNMKELRFDAHEGTQVWRAAFAFDPQRKAIVLVAGDKQGEDEERFYKALLKKANKRYDRHLAGLKEESKAKGQGKGTLKGKTKTKRKPTSKTGKRI